MRFIKFLLCLLIVSCNSSRNLDIQGHRGCRGLMPENTIPAFQKAIDIGVTTLELDVVISKDHQVVVSHEPFMNHAIVLDLDGNEITPQNERNYNLFNMSYDSIRLYDCGTKEHSDFSDQKHMKISKPLLADVIDMAEHRSDHSISYNIEIKSKPEYDNVYSPRPEMYVDLVMDVIKSKRIQSRTTLQSFDIRALEIVYKKTRRTRIALLVDENENISQKVSSLSFKPNIISPYYKLLDQQLVSLWQDRGFQIIPWTVNEIGDINLMIDFNVDGIISDYPNIVIQLESLKK